MDATERLDKYIQNFENRYGDVPVLVPESLVRIASAAAAANIDAVHFSANPDVENYTSEPSITTTTGINTSTIHHVNPQHKQETLNSHSLQSLDSTAATQKLVQDLLLPPYSSKLFSQRRIPGVSDAESEISETASSVTQICLEGSSSSIDLQRTNFAVSNAIAAALAEYKSGFSLDAMQNPMPRWLSQSPQDSSCSSANAPRRHNVQDNSRIQAALRQQAACISDVLDEDTGMFGLTRAQLTPSRSHQWDASCNRHPLNALATSNIAKDQALTTGSKEASQGWQSQERAAMQRQPNTRHEDFTCNPSIVELRQDISAWHHLSRPSQPCIFNSSLLSSSGIDMHSAPQDRVSRPQRPSNAPVLKPADVLGQQELRSSTLWSTRSPLRVTRSTISNPPLAPRRHEHATHEAAKAVEAATVASTRASIVTGQKDTCQLSRKAKAQAPCANGPSIISGPPLLGGPHLQASSCKSMVTSSLSPERSLSSIPFVPSDQVLQPVSSEPSINMTMQDRRSEVLVARSDSAAQTEFHTAFALVEPSQQHVDVKLVSDPLELDLPGHSSAIYANGQCLHEGQRCILKPDELVNLNGAGPLPDSGQQVTLAAASKRTPRSISCDIHHRRDSPQRHALLTQTRFHEVRDGSTCHPPAEGPRINLESKALALKVQAAYNMHADGSEDAEAERLNASLKSALARGIHHLNRLLPLTVC